MSPIGSLQGLAPSELASPPLFEVVAKAGTALGKAGIALANDEDPTPDMLESLRQTMPFVPGGVFWGLASDMVQLFDVDAPEQLKR